MSIVPLSIPKSLHGNPTAALQWSQTVKTKNGDQLPLACPTATRAMIALMDMAAVQGGAACHFGGPSAFAETLAMMGPVAFSICWLSSLRPPAPKNGKPVLSARRLPNAVCSTHAMPGFRSNQSAASLSAESSSHTASMLGSKRSFVFRH